MAGKSVKATYVEPEGYLPKDIRDAIFKKYSKKPTTAKKTVKKDTKKK